MALRPRLILLAALAGIAVSAAMPAAMAQDSVTLTPRVIPVGKWAEGIALSQGALWVSESGQRTIAQFNPATGALLRRIPVGRLPVQMSVGRDGAVYTLVHTDRLIWRQDPSAPGTAITGLQGCPADLTTTAGHLWVLTMPDCSSNTARLIRMDYRGNGRVMSEPLPNWAQAIAAHRGKIWIAHANAPGLTIVDQQDLSFTTLRVGASLWAIAARGDSVHLGGRLEQDNARGVVIAIDPVSLREKARRSVDQRIAVMADDGRNVVAIGENGKIWVFAAGNLQLRRTITLAAGAFKPTAAIIRDGELYLSSGQHIGTDGAVLVVSGWNPDAQPATAPPPAAPSQPPAPPPPAARQDCPARVVNVAESGVLWVHQDPDIETPKLVGIPASTANIVVQRCIRAWCLVTYRGSSGWVDRQFIRQDCN